MSRCPAVSFATFALVCLLGMPALESLAQEGGKSPSASLLDQGMAEMKEHHYEEALKNFKKANQIEHEACGECYLGMASAETQLGQLDEALKSADKAIQHASNDQFLIASHALKGRILLNMGDDPKKLKASEAEYRTATQLDPKYATIHLSLGIVLLRESLEKEGIEELNTYLRLDPQGADVRYARKLIANPKRAGDPLAPPFNVTTLGGQDISLDQLAGKIVVLDFWATWCPPCRAAVPEFKELTKKYPPSQLTLISFSVDSDQQAWRDFIAKHGMEWPQYRDGDGHICKDFGVKAFPTYLVID